MKRKTVALMTALTLAMSLSACGDKTAPQADIPDTASVEETAQLTEKPAPTEEPTPEPTPEITLEEKVQSAIDEMPYYGDTANCKMTAEQATAFAQLIADGLAGDFSFRGGYDERFDIISWSEPFYEYEYDNPIEVDRTRVILGDFSAEGKPYLYIYSSRELSSFEVYGWNGNEPILSGSGTIEVRAGYSLSEQEDGTVRLVEQAFNTETYRGDECLWAAVTYLEYAFIDGNLEQVSERALAKLDPLDNSDFFYIIENGEQTGVCPEEDYEIYLEKAPHQHTLPYTCFYDMTPCILEEMVNYLNVYASVMSDGQSVPVEIKKVDIVKHDGTGITTKGEVPQEKVDSLEILRKYMIEDVGIGSVNDGDSTMYANPSTGQVLAESAKDFYFGLADLNNDGKQDILVSYKRDGWDFSYTDLYLGSSFEEILPSINGANLSEGTYLCTGGSVFAIVCLYVYDGTTFSIICELNEEEDYKYSLTENGETREISAEEFNSIWADWESKNTDISANIHLDIENIENTFQVKIDVQSSGEWLVTNAE